MTTQPRQATQRSATFHRATLKASLVLTCCGLVLWSAVAAHAGVDGNGLYLNGLPMNGLPLNGIPLNGMPINGLPAKEGSLPPAQSESLPWSTLSQRPLGTSTP
jgi:hypothetical protein